MSAVSELKSEQTNAKAGALSRAAVRDCLFLGSIVFLSLILYVSQLGFYSDDWVFLSLLNMSDDQTLPGLYKALYAGDVVIRQRPVQIIYLVILYSLSGLNPTGYHLANAAVLVGTSVLFYLSLRELGRSRLLAITVPLVYSMLPHYSTDRFWVAAFQATLSVAFYFASLYADIRALRDYPARLGRWKFISVASLLLSVLAYEVTLPLFLLNPLLVWYAAGRRPWANARRQLIRTKVLKLFGANLVALLFVVGFKLLVTVRTNVATDFFSHLFYVIAGAVTVNFGTYGIGLPYILWWILRHKPPWFLLFLAGLLGTLIFIYLYRLREQPGEALHGRNTWIRLAGLGLLVFASGYAIFIASADIWFTSTSLGNRVAIAAAIGIAITLTGLIGWLSALLPSKAGSYGIFCLLVTLLCIHGFMINNTLAVFWIRAYEEQQAILNDIRNNIPAFPSQSRLILDGACLEHGGAYVFTGKRDLAAILRLHYDDRSLEATAITNSPRIEQEGLSVMTYRNRDFYPYGEKLLVYNYERKQIHRLTDYRAAQQYFQNSGFAPEADCPPGFAWGWNSP